MRPLERVVWSEGMFLSPQHLQQLDLYHERLLHQTLEARGARGFGVVACALSREALAAGQVQLERFFGLLGDGLPLQFERGDAVAPAARPIESHFGPAQRALEIYLAVPKVRAEVADAEGVSGYAVSARPVADLFPANPLSANTTRSVSFAHRRVQLLFGDEPRDNFEALKIAVIVRDALGALVEDPSYVPPCLRLDAAPFVVEGLRRLLGQMAAKQRVLADARRHREATSVEFTPADLTRTLHMRALNLALPLLNHLVDAEDAHPYQAYLCLLQVAGELFTFDAEADPLSLPKYRATNLGPMFAELFARLDHLLKALAAELTIPIALDARAGGLFVGTLEDPRFARCQFFLAVKSELPEQQVTEQIPRLLKIASVNDIHRIVQAAAPGVPLQPTFRPPPEISPRPGVIYFSLETRDEYWKNAVRDRTVALYLPQPFDAARTKLELLGIPGAGG